MNKLELTRLALGFGYTLWDKGRVKVTLEAVDRKQKTETEHQVVTKFAFIEIDDFVHPHSQLRIGASSLGWTPYSEQIWGYRLQGPVFTDRFGYIGTTDIGIFLKSTFQASYLDYQFDIVSGEGFRNYDKDNYKDLHFRLTVHPSLTKGSLLYPFSLSGGIVRGMYYDQTKSGYNNRNREMIQIAYKIPKQFTLAGEYLLARDPDKIMTKRYPSIVNNSSKVNAEGFSIIGILNFSVVSNSDFLSNMELIGRYDRLRPQLNRNNSNAELGIIGLSYQYNEHILLLLDAEAAYFTNLPNNPKERRLLAQMEIKF